MSSFHTSSNETKMNISDNVSGLSGRPESSVVNVSSISKFDNDLKLWSFQLQPFLEPAAIVCAPVFNGTLKKVDLSVIVQHIKKLGFFNSTTAVNALPNPVFVKIKFESAELASAFSDLISPMNNMEMKIIKPMDSPDKVTIYINNLPAEDIIPLVGPKLARWGEFIQIIPNFIPTDKGNCQVGQSRCIFQFKDGFTIKDLPYMVRVYSFKVQLFVRGRPKVCFRCGDLSHVVACCQWRYCGVCRRLQLVEHLCVQSYAQAAGKLSVPEVNINMEKLVDSALALLDEPCTDVGSIAGLSDSVADNFDNLQTMVGVDKDIGLPGDDSKLKRARVSSSSSTSSSDPLVSEQAAALPDLESSVTESFINVKKKKKKKATSVVISSIPVKENIQVLDSSNIAFQRSGAVGHDRVSDSRSTCDENVEFTASSNSVDIVELASAQEFSSQRVNNDGKVASFGVAGNLP